MPEVRGRTEERPIGGYGAVVGEHAGRVEGADGDAVAVPLAAGAEVVAVPDGPALRAEAGLRGAAERGVEEVGVELEPVAVELDLGDRVEDARGGRRGSVRPSQSSELSV
jgi:hypothetical protein